MNRITDKHKIMRFTVLFMMLYMISYITRINYGAVISAMVETDGLSKSQASLALTASAITYGIGQLLSGFLGDKVQPKKLITVGLLVTISMNLCIPFCANTAQMTAVWGVNGLAQAFMWPPLVRIMMALFSEEGYKQACVKVSWGSSCGTIVVYLLAPICISLAGWRSIFFISAACALAMVFVWQKACPTVENSEAKRGKETRREVAFPKYLLVLLPMIMLAICLQGMLRDGVTTWMPSFISETFDLGSSISILTGVVLPIFAIATYQLVSMVYKRIKNELFLGGLIFAVGFLSAGLLIFANGKNAILSVLFTALITASMHGVNMILVCMVPAYFGRFGRVSFASGLLNFCTYVGSAISTYGMAVFSENYGWNNTVILWMVIAFLGTVMCFAAVKLWTRFVKEK